MAKGMKVVHKWLKFGNSSVKPNLTGLYFAEMFREFVIIMDILPLQEVTDI